MIETIRTEKPAVLLLDSGEVFGPLSDRDNAELHLKAMERMGYDALNLAGPELSLGKDFLERSRSLVSFPYIASNLLYEGGRPPWIREYVIKEVGGIKVAIVGILDHDGFTKLSVQDHLKGFEVIPPGIALDRILPEVKGKADLVILLSPLTEEMNRDLMASGRGVDLIFSPGSSAVQYGNLPEDADFVLHAGGRGMTIGMATVTLDGQGARRISERRAVPLDRTVPDNAMILGLVQTYKKEQEIKKEKKNKELMEGLQLTPQEFMERYRKRQTEQNK
jgi:5'-nucleotidase / UDP-sugar diphosphatase